MENIFTEKSALKIIERINKLSPSTNAIWGKMNVAQMLAHCNVTYEMVYDNKHKPAKGLKKILLKAFVKPTVCGEKNYPKNSRTAPQFIIESEKEFNIEKNRLIEYLTKTQQLGEDFFEGKESNSFGKLNIKEWNNMFYKHLNHHLQQFGV